MKPIPFNTEMVRAILDGRKTVTRRVVKPQPDKSAYSPYEGIDGRFSFRVGERGCTVPYKPPYRTGDILYVQETWYYETFYEDTDNPPDLPSGHRSWRYVYKVDNPEYPVIPGHWRSPINMPRETARIFLRVKDIKVERLQDISASDCIAEGIYWEDVTPNVPVLPDNPAFDMDAVIALLQEVEEQRLIRNSYGSLWDSTIKPADRDLYGWETNPWVFVISFERISKDEALQ